MVEELLQRLAGPGATFREHQREAITDLVEDRARVLCVQRTGWGKSAVYFLATTLLPLRSMKSLYELRPSPEVMAVWP